MFPASRVDRGLSRVIRKGAIVVPTRYALAAGFCAMLHNAIVITADRAGFSLWQAAATSFCVLAVTGYLLLCSVVFRGTRSWIGFLRYTGAMAINFPLSTALLSLFFFGLRQPMAIAAPAATIAMVVVNYFAGRWAITGDRANQSAGV